MGKVEQFFPCKGFVGFYYISKRFLEGKAVSSLGVVLVVFGGWFQYFVFSSSKTIIPNLGSLYSAATDDALCYYLWCFLNSNLNAFAPQLQSQATFQCYDTQVISQMDHLIRIDSSLEARSAIRSNQRSLWPSLEVAKGDQEQMPQEVAKTRQAHITPLQLSTGFKTLQPTPFEQGVVSLCLTSSMSFQFLHLLSGACGSTTSLHHLHVVQVKKQLLLRPSEAASFTRHPPQPLWKEAVSLPTFPVALAASQASITPLAHLSLAGWEGSPS